MRLPKSMRGGILLVSFWLSLKTVDTVVSVSETSPPRALSAGQPGSRLWSRDTPKF